MSNTVRRPRKRPRVRSCSFRTLGWLIRREATWCICWNRPYAPTDAEYRRRWAWQNTQATHHAALRVLAKNPKRRYYP